MIQKSWTEITDKINSLSFVEPFDLVVGIARGGIVPAALIAQKLGLPLEILRINYRDDGHRIQREQPELLQDFMFISNGKNILLVDDVSRTGATFRFTKGVLSNAALIKTLAVNGESDYSLFQEQCFIFPWANASKL